MRQGTFKNIPAERDRKKERTSDEKGSQKGKYSRDGPLFVRKPIKILSPKLLKKVSQPQAMKIITKEIRHGANIDATTHQKSMPTFVRRR